MKEYVLVEFLFAEHEAMHELEKLICLGDDFVYLSNQLEYEDDSETGICTDYQRVTGKINSQVASLIKLQNPALAGKMRISYIDEELKNKYRR